MFDGRPTILRDILSKTFELYYLGLNLIVFLNCSFYIGPTIIIVSLFFPSFYSPPILDLVSVISKQLQSCYLIMLLWKYILLL